MGKMVAMKLSWLLVELFTVILFLYTGNICALAVCSMLFLVPCLSAAVNLLAGRKLTVSVSSPGSLQKGKWGTFTILLENPTIFPLLYISMRVSIENQLNGGTQSRRVITWVMPKKTQRIPLQVYDDYCGSIRITAEQPVLYDCFGLAGIRCGTGGASHLTVLPETFPSRILLQPSCMPEESDVYSQERPGQDLSETYQIREYIPGDDLRQIHWKLTGKFDRLIVRDPALPIVNSILVFWERTGGTDNPECIDAQAETVVSVCKSLLEESAQFTIGWNDTEKDVCVLHEIHDLDEMIGIMPRLLRAAGKKSGISGAELLLQTARHALCAHMIYIAENPPVSAQELRNFGNTAILQCGKMMIEESIPFNSTQYKEQLSQIVV